MVLLYVPLQQPIAQIYFACQVILNLCVSISNRLIIHKGHGPVGTYTFSVNVYPNGLAKMLSATTFTYNLSANSISPTESGTGGE